MGRRIRSIARLVKANVVLFPIVVTFIRDHRRFVLFGGPRQLTQEQRRDRARRLTEAFERLGTTYIKLAQFLTTRPDFVPPLYIQELEKLQDDVAPAPFDEIRERVEEELGPIDKVFDEFDEEAISGASIAQVHRAVIDGEEVAVKVRRPGLEKVVEADLANLAIFVPKIVRILHWIGQESHATSAEGVTDELQKTIREEMDFDREREIMSEIRANIERDGLDEIAVIPRAYDEYSTDAVLTMSYEPGVKVKYMDELQAKGHDLEVVVDRIAETYLTMAFEHEVFQADPHHGNLAVSDDGRVIIYDFGISQRPDRYLLDAFTRFFIGAGLQNPSIAVDALHEMGAVDPSVNRETIELATEIMIKDTAGMEISDAEIQRLEARVDQTLYDFPLRLPQEVILGFRTTFGVEGLCAKMAPDYDFTQKLHEFFLESGVAEKFDLAEVAQQESNGDGGGSGPTVDTEELRADIERGLKRNGKLNLYAIVGASFVVSGAVLATARGVAPLPVGSVVVGLLAFVLARRSLKERGRVVGPAYLATRHRMDQWEDEKEPVEDPVEAEVTVGDN